MKWQGYAEPTWELFSAFAKDASVLVERYFIRKSLLKTLQEYQELKKAKTGEELTCINCRRGFGGVSEVTKST